MILLPSRKRVGLRGFLHDKRLDKINLVGLDLKMESSGRKTSRWRLINRHSWPPSLFSHYEVIITSLRQLLKAQAVMEPQKPLPGKGAAYPKQHRRNYPRSKDGCLNCRAKRKKCDKAKPYCNACVRSTQTCVWPGDDTKESQSDSNSSPTAPTSEQTDIRAIKSEGKRPIVSESDQALTDLNFAMVSLVCLLFGQATILHSQG